MIVILNLDYTVRNVESDGGAIGASFVDAEVTACIVKEIIYPISIKINSIVLY